MTFVRDLVRQDRWLPVHATATVLAGVVTVLGFSSDAHADWLLRACLIAFTFLLVLVLAARVMENLHEEETEPRRLDFVGLGRSGHADTSELISDWQLGPENHSGTQQSA